MEAGQLAEKKTGRIWVRFRVEDDPAKARWRDVSGGRNNQTGQANTQKMVGQLESSKRAAQTQDANVRILGTTARPNRQPKR